MNKFEWNKRLKPYTNPDWRRSGFQIANSILPYFMVWGAEGLLLTSPQVPLWAKILGALPLTVIGGLLMVRIFILFHDCTHLSFFKSKTACSIWGHVFGILTFTPYKTWQHEHNMHHGSVGDLDRRGMGDVWTLTVTEYLSKSRFGRLVYRVYRNPLVLFIVSPVVLFGILNRFPTRKTSPQEGWSYAITNTGLLAGFIVSAVLFGWPTYFAIQIPMLFVAATAGVWLFFVQHQFEEVYWAHHEEWDIVRAALEGSTFFRLPAVLEWFTGHIGYHHIHHLNARIPNYYLKRCFKEVEGLEPIKTIQFFTSFKLALLHLYDDVNGKMIGFGELRRRQRGLSS